MNITYFGHSCFQLEADGAKILFDPFIRPNPLAAAIDVAKLQPDCILISHGHYDHLADAEEIANNSSAQIIANWEIATWFEKRGVKNTQPMNTGGTVYTPFGKVSMTAALHSSSLPDGSYGGNPNGFIVASAEERFYYSGDTDVFGDMQLIGKRYQPTFAFLPIGDHFTMDVLGACEAAQLLAVKKVIGMHFDTFPPIRIDHDKAIQLFAEKDIELLLMNIGDTIQL